MQRQRAGVAFTLSKVIIGEGRGVRGKWSKGLRVQAAGRAASEGEIK